MSVAALYLPCLLGMQCDGFTMIAADQTNIQASIIVMSDDEDKIYDVGNNVMIGVVGQSGDVAQFTNYISKNIKLYNIRNGYDLNTDATVHFARMSLAELVRSRTPTLVNTLIGGYDSERKAQLYTMDFLASSMKVPFSSFGFGGLFCQSIMDEYYRPSLTIEEAYEIMKLCIKEVHKRLLVHLPSFRVKIVSGQGVLSLPIINESSFRSKQ